MLDLLRQGKAPTINQVAPRDVVNETTGRLERLDGDFQKEIVCFAKQALQKMIELIENSY